jgi:esterase/lipase superfamily enzyme
MRRLLCWAHAAALALVVALLGGGGHIAAQAVNRLPTKQGVAGLKYSPHSKYLAVLEKTGVLTIHIKGQRKPWGVFGREEGVRAVPAFSGDETQLATAHDVKGGHEVRLWRLDQPKTKPFRVLPRTGPVTALAFGGKGTQLACGNAGGQVQVFDVRTGAVVASFGKESKDAVRTLAFTADGLSIAIETQAGVKIWRLEPSRATPMPRMVKEFAQPSKDARPLQFSPDSKTLAVPDAAKNVKLLDAATGKERALAKTKAPVETIRFTAPGELAVVGKDGTASVVETTKGKTLVESKRALPSSDSAAIAPEANAVVTSQPDGSVEITPLVEDTRYTKEGDYLQLPIYFGTNRAPKTDEESDWNRYFRRYFLSLFGARIGGVLLAAWLLPLMVVALLTRLGGDGRTALIVAVVGLAAALVYLTLGWWMTLEGLATAAILMGGAALAAMLRGQPAWASLAAVLVLWLGSWSLLAFFGAQHMVQRDHQAPGAYFGNERLNEVQLGVCTVTIPRVYKVGSGIVLRPENFFGIEFKEDPARHVTLREPTILLGDEFFRRLQGEVARMENPRREALVFIHGYNTSFEDAAYRTALLARDLHFPGPPILFSWPSHGQLEDYGGDEEAEEYSRELFRAVLEEIAERSGAERIYLVAHSMGNRLLTHMLRDLLPKHEGARKLFREVVLAAPDIDRKYFEDRLLDKIVKQGPRVTLYASSKDIALATSKSVHKYVRVGQGGDDLLVRPELHSIDASPLDTTGLSHDYAFTHPDVQEDIRLLCLEGHDPDLRKLTAQERGELKYWLFSP